MNKIARKIGVAVIALVTIVSVSGITPVVAQTPAETLQAQINTLLAQIATLQGQLGGGVTTPAPAPAFNFTRNLTVGSTGEDVRALQQFLNARGFTVATTGPGSIGNESTRFGPRTQAALARFQSANNVSPARGFFGPLTRARIATVAPVTPVTPVTPIAPGLAVSLAPDSPAATTLIAGQALAELARFRFTNGETREARVTQVALTRAGISADATLSAVYLYDGVRRLTDLAGISAGRISFVDAAGLFTIPAGGSRTISVRSDILALTQGQTIGVNLLVADVRADVAITPVALPISGSIMSIASADLATVGVAATTLTGTPTVDAGTRDLVVWNSNLAIGARNATFHSLQLRQIGSVRTGDIENFRLFVRGLEVGRATLATDNTVTFDLSTAPVSLTSSAALEVRADVVAGSGRTFSFALWRATDLDVRDSEFRVGVLATGTFPVSTGLQTIGSGTLNIVRATDSPTTNVVADGRDVVLARYTLTAFGESVRVTRLAVGLTNTTGTLDPITVTLRNGRLLANGVQVGPTASIVADTGTSYELGGGLTVVPGTPVTLEVRADIFDSEGANEIGLNDRFTVRLLAGTNNAQTTGSLTLSGAPTANVDANNLTVSTGGLVLASNAAFAARNVVAGNDVHIGSFVIQAGPAEAVNISNYVVGVGVATGVALADLSNLRISESTIVRGSVTATNNFSVNQRMEPNTTRVVDVFVNVASTVTTGNIIPTLNITAHGVVTNAPVTVGQANGPAIAVALGNIVPTPSPASIESGIVIGGTSGPFATYRFTATNEAFRVTDATIAVTNASSIVNLTLGGVTVPVVDGRAVFSGLSINVPAGTTGVDVPLTANWNRVDAGAGTSGNASIATLASFKANGVTSGRVIEPTNLTIAGNSMTLRRTAPTVTSSAGDTTLMAGERTLMRVTVGANSAGDVTLNRLGVRVTTGALTTLAAGSVIEIRHNNIVIGTTTALETAHGAGAGANYLIGSSHADRIVPAGQSRTFDIVVTGVTVGTAPNDLVAQLLSDATAGIAGNFLWRDGSVTTDINGFQVRTLPSSSFTMERR